MGVVDWWKLSMEWIDRCWCWFSMLAVCLQNWRMNWKEEKEERERVGGKKDRNLMWCQDPQGSPDSSRASHFMGFCGVNSGIHQGEQLSDPIQTRDCGHGERWSYDSHVADLFRSFQLYHLRICQMQKTKLRDDLELVRIGIQSR